MFSTKTLCGESNAGFQFLRKPLHLILRRFKVFWCYSMTFLHRTPASEWCLVRWGSKNRHRHLKTNLSKEIGLRLQILSTFPHSIINTIGRTYVFIEE
jgi:hypothetical protein